LPGLFVIGLDGTGSSARLFPKAGLWQNAAMMILCNSAGRVGLPAAGEVLRRGGSALDAVEVGVRLVEKDPQVDSVGFGGHPNLTGIVECDAAVMDGATRMSGAVAGLTGALHAVSVARAVMERLPHVLLCGEGADRFAREIGADRGPLLTEPMRAFHEAWITRRIPEPDRLNWPDVPLAEHAWTAVRSTAEDLPHGRGTTIFLALDGHGRISAASSTSGWARKYPGRIGDTPIIGAGLYADGRYGACGCTHTGEMTLRASTARLVVLAMKRGASVTEACHEAVDDLADLRDGLRGPVIIHAIDARGGACVVSNEPMGSEAAAWIWADGETGLRRVPPAFRPSDSPRDPGSVADQR